MRRSTSLRERRLIALLILLGMVALGYLAIVMPIATGFADRAARTQELMLRYQHNLRTIASIPRLRRQAERQRAAIADFAIQARTVEAGREWLKQRLQGAIERAGGDVREVGDGEAPSGWARARISARMTLPQLAAALDQLQNQPPYLVVEALTVASDEALVTGLASSLDIDLEASVPFRFARAR